MPHRPTGGPLRRLIPVAVFGPALVLAACGDAPNDDRTSSTTGASDAEEVASGRDEPAADLTEGCLDEAGDGVDHFPDQINTEHAANFTVEYHDTYKVVTVHEPTRGGDPVRYVLTLCGTPAPTLDGDLEAATVVEVPITTMFSGSSTQNPWLIALDQLDTLTGVSRAEFINTESVVDRIDAGQVVEYAPAGEIDVELVVTTQPGIVTTGGLEKPEVLEQLQNAGVPVVHEAAWLEATPLARAEWIKFMALFFNEEALATELFEEIEQRYVSLAELTAELSDEDRPSVMLGFIYEGTFRAPGGASYQAAIVEDAGGDYIWADRDDSSGLQLDIEEQLVAAHDAEFWMSTELNDWATLDDVIAVDPRLADLASVQTGQVWVNRLKVNEAGGNEFWERAPAYPDLWLADLIKIMHPDLLPDHEFEWHQRVPAAE